MAERGGSAADSGGVVEEKFALRGADLKREGDAEMRLDWRNTMIKWFVDCITIGALVNTVAFLVLMGALKSKSFGEMGMAVRTVSSSFWRCFSCGGCELGWWWW